MKAMNSKGKPGKIHVKPQRQRQEIPPKKTSIIVEKKSQKLTPEDKTGPLEEGQGVIG